MGKTQWNPVNRGLVLSAAYCAAYLGLWYFSFDQWFLPLSLRLACLFVLPYRLWPYVFLGDAAALLVLRVPKAGTYSTEWAYISPLLSLPLASLTIVGIKRLIPNVNCKMQWFPFTALALSVSATVSNLSINRLLSGPIPDDLMNTFIVYSVGQYLGALTFAPLYLLWLRWKENPFPLRPLLGDCLITATFMGFMIGFIVLAPESTAPLRQVTLFLLILPVMFMTQIHGWAGAATGVALINIAVSLTLKHTGIPGAHNDLVFQPQILLALGGTLLLVVGAKLTEHYDFARNAGVAETVARELARGSFPATESKMREQLIYMAHQQLMSDDIVLKAVEYLKKHGHAQAAMDLNSLRVEQRRLFDRRSPMLYPMRIETDGLFAVIYSNDFRDFWTGSAEIISIMIGQPRSLTRDLQLNAYRCICAAMTVYADTLPNAYRLKLRVWQAHGQRGIYIRVSADMTELTRTTLNGVAADSELTARALASGGILRKNRYRIALLLAESVDAVSSPVIPVPQW